MLEPRDHCGGEGQHREAAGGHRCEQTRAVEHEAAQRCQLASQLIGDERLRCDLRLEQGQSRIKQDRHRRAVAHGGQGPRLRTAEGDGGGRSEHRAVLADNTSTQSGFRRVVPLSTNHYGARYLVFFCAYPQELIPSDSLAPGPWNPGKG